MAGYALASACSSATRASMAARRAWASLVMASTRAVTTVTACSRRALRVFDGLLHVGDAGGDVLLDGRDALLHVGDGVADDLDGEVGDADAGEDGLEGFGLDVELGGGHVVLLLVGC